MTIIGFITRDTCGVDSGFLVRGEDEVAGAGVGVGVGAGVGAGGEGEGRGGEGTGGREGSNWTPSSEVNNQRAVSDDNYLPD